MTRLIASLVELVRRYGAELLQQAPDAVLPGSYWGESEAGLRGNVLYVRADTPWHSVLHELSHLRVHDAGAARGPGSRCRRR